MFVIGLIFAGLAVVLHFFIFYLESFAWTTKALSVFDMTPQSAEATREMAFHQGFYNLFLALIALVGILVYSGSPDVGSALIFSGVGAMLAAALLLFVSSPGKRSAALKQGIFPLLSLVFLSFGLMP